MLRFLLIVELVSRFHNDHKNIGNVVASCHIAHRLEVLKEMIKIS